MVPANGQLFLRNLFPFGRVHAALDSLFSSSSGYTNYSGFVNLAIVLLALANARLFLENLLKYGLLVDPLQWTAAIMRDPYSWPNASLLFCSNVYILIAFAVEKLVAQVS